MMCVIQDGVLYAQKKKKNNSVCELGYITYKNIHPYYVMLTELRFVRIHEEQHHISTAGHMG